MRKYFPLFCGALFIFLCWVLAGQSQVLSEGDVSRRPALSDKVIDHSETIRTIDESGRLIRLGNTLFAEGRYVEAADAFKSSFDIGPQAVSGLKLVTCYEKLGRNREGIALLDAMVQGGYLSPNGIATANVIKARLCAEDTEVS